MTAVLLCCYLVLSVILTNSRWAWSDDVAPIVKRRVTQAWWSRAVASELSSFQEPRKEAPIHSMRQLS
jgi:hypothetical protein